MSNLVSLDNIINSKNMKHSTIQPDVSKHQDNIPFHNKDVVNALNIKAIIGLLVIFILVTNTLFTEHILSKIKGTYNGKQLSIVGIIVQSIIMIILYIALLFLIKYEIV